MYFNCQQFCIMTVIPLKAPLEHGSQEDAITSAEDKLHSALQHQPRGQNQAGWPTFLIHFFCVSDFKLIFKIFEIRNSTISRKCFCTNPFKPNFFLSVSKLDIFQKAYIFFSNSLTTPSGPYILIIQEIRNKKKRDKNIPQFLSKVSLVHLQICYFYIFWTLYSF